MFSNYYQIGESIELFNSQDKSLLSKWGFLGKSNKVYDPKLHTYEMVLSVGNLSKMQIPKNSKIKTLSLFQSFIVFQLYLYTSKQLTIEIAISDSTNAKRRLIFSTNNLDLSINQLHCRIPLFKLPIGRWINLSIDILSFVSKCYKNLTFRSVDYISLSMSGKTRYIFAMRTPLIEYNNKFEIDENGNIIENNDLISDNINYESDIYNNETNYFEECFHTCLFCSLMSSTSSESQQNCLACSNGYQKSYEYMGNCYKIDINDNSDKIILDKGEESFTTVNSCQETSKQYKINSTGECVSECPSISLYKKYTFQYVDFFNYDFDHSIPQYILEDEIFIWKFMLRKMSSWN